ncbi:enhancer of split mgamma protein-like [Ruditapes philippinarum]|uniref:enhancer of split mgamma protein-like n=1 Tax=Ruditapes philippinarum TaxID=129788 RepID=UPI00295A938C|nr:enhancer of split mgamma protein-like [Ruditapes philippinarum]
MGGAKNSKADDMSYAKKIRKPMIEKKRRERMNKSISHLKSLIAHTIQQNTAPMTRVDKADILELTVYHLTQLTQQQQSVTMATEAAAYNTGYKACAREAVTYLAKNTRTSDTVTGSLSNHLHNLFLTNSKRLGPANTRYSTHGSTNQNIQINRLSTPLRPCDTFNTSLPELNLSGYSPILNSTQALPELTSSFVHASLDSSSSSGFSSTSSLATTSSSDSYSSLSEYSKVNDSCSDNGENDKDYCIDVVTIGTGKENEIGHVIKEVPWRPF